MKVWIAFECSGDAYHSDEFTGVYASLDAAKRGAHDSAGRTRPFASWVDCVGYSYSDYLSINETEVLE